MAAAGDTGWITGSAVDAGLSFRLTSQSRSLPCLQLFSIFLSGSVHGLPFNDCIRSVTVLVLSSSIGSNGMGRFWCAATFMFPRRFAEPSNPEKSSTEKAGSKGELPTNGLPTNSRERAAPRKTTGSRRGSWATLVFRWNIPLHTFAHGLAAVTSPIMVVLGL